MDSAEREGLLFSELGFTKSLNHKRFSFPKWGKRRTQAFTTATKTINHSQPFLAKLVFGKQEGLILQYEGLLWEPEQKSLRFSSSHFPHYQLFWSIMDFISHLIQQD